MKRKIALSFVTLLAMVGTSFAAIGMDFDYKDLGNGLIQYKIYAFGTDGDKPSVIDGICVQGGQGVHNVAIPSGGIPAVIFDTDWNDFMMDPALKEFDSHFITPAGGYKMLGPTPTETNDGTNPAGLPETNTYCLPYSIGLGTLTSSVDTALGFQADPSGQTYVLQFVTPRANYKNIFITGFVRGPGIDQPIAMPLFIPEPGTIAMLVFGGLCLVGIRLRKKRISSNN